MTKTMKNTVLLTLILISTFGFSQNIFKKEIQLRKSNNIKETTFYVKYPKGKKHLKKIESYDRSGLLVELKKFDENGNVEQRLTFEYPNDQTRILNEYDKNDSLVTSYNQKFDSSTILEPNKRKSDSKKFKYKYDKKGNLTEVWRLDLKKPLLQTESFYDEENRLIKQRLLIFEMFPKKYYYLTTEYNLDEEGNIIEIKSIKNGKKKNTETREHKKYST
jgi:uncharacterized protein YxeA